MGFETECLKIIALTPEHLEVLATDIPKADNLSSQRALRRWGFMESLRKETICGDYWI